MYAPPSFLTIKQFNLWVRWILRNHNGKFALVFGKQVVPEKIAGTNQVYRSFGPCGPNPYYHLRVFLVTDTAEGEDTVELKDHKPDRYFSTYVTLDQKDWDTVADTYRKDGKYSEKVWSNEGDFCGPAVVIDAPELGAEEREKLEKDFDEAWEKKSTPAKRSSEEPEESPRKYKIREDRY